MLLPFFISRNCVPKGTHSMGGIYPAIAWLATIYDAYGIILNNLKH